MKGIEDWLYEDRMRADRPCASCGQQRKRANSTLCRSCWLAQARKP